jgi:hypothetical protein
MTLHLRYRTLKLRVLYLVLRRPRARARSRIGGVAVDNT